MEPYETYLALGLALAVGLLVGLEREQTKPERGHGELGGIRTFPLFALVGALATLLAPTSAWLPVIALVGVITLVTVSYAGDIRREGDHGMTTEISVIGVYLLGALATSRGVVEPIETRMILVAALGVAMTFLLSSKQWFHRLASRISRHDFYATVKFLIVAVIVLPLLPDADMGPLDAINARNLGLLVVTISGLSFAGYVGMRFLGAERGLLLGAALGGLVSSTAVTLSFAGRAKREPALVPVAAGAIALAWTIMLGRVAVVVALVQPALLRGLVIPLGAMIVAALLGFALTFRRGSAGGAGLALANPFELGSAIKVTVLFGVVLLLSKAATVYLGPEGLYLASAVSGTTDVDAITLSTARLAGGVIGEGVATIAIVIAIAANTLVKAAMAWASGTAALGRRLAITGALIIVAGGLALAASAG